MNVLLWILAACAALVCWLLWARSVRKMLAGVHEIPICRMCGYSLAGLDAAAMCPECGTTEPAKREVTSTSVWVRFDQWRASAAVVGAMIAASAWPTVCDAMLRLLAREHLLGFGKHGMPAEISPELGLGLGGMGFFVLMVFGFALDGRAGWARVRVGWCLAAIWLFVLTVAMLVRWNDSNAGSANQALEMLVVMGLALALFGGSVPALVVLFQFFAWVMARVRGTAELLDIAVAHASGE